MIGDLARALLDASPLAMILVDLNAQIRAINQPAQELFAWPAAELIGQPLEVLVPERLRARHVAGLRAYLADPVRRLVGHGVGVRGCRRDGRELDLEITVNPMASAAGPLIAAAIVDVTARVAVEAALSRSEQHLTAAQRITRCGSWELDLGELDDLNRNPLRWSDEVFRIFGHEPGSIEVSNETFFAAVHPEDRDAITAAIRHAVDTGTTYALDHRIVRPDGEIRIVHEQSELRLDEHGRPALMIGTVQDVTEQRLAADALRKTERAEQEARARWQALVESAPDVISELDPDGTVRFINRVGPGRDPAQFVGRSWLDAAPESARPALDAARRSVLATGDATTFEMPGTERDGTPVWWAGHLGPIRRDDQIVGLVVIARDITARRRSEAQLMVSDRMATVGTLAAGVAHEINNPLAAAMASLELLVRDLGPPSPNAALPPRIHDRLRDARHACERVRAIVRDLNLMSRAEDDRQGPVWVEAVLDATLRMAWNELRHRARVIKDYGRPPPALANEARLGQVFLNLIVNAAQAIPEGDVEAHEVRIATSTAADGRVVVTVADTGRGIPAEIQPRIFTPFLTTKPVGVGTGLGLSICHRIVTALGGEISFTSEAGRGTEFRVVLPVAHEPGRAIPPPPSPSPPPPPRRGRVLIVDDEPIITKALGRLLGDQHDVTEAHSARQALDAIRGGAEFDVILCDLMMPHMTGMELYAELERLTPAQAQRMIFMTGGVFTPQVREFRDAVANPWLDKPFDVDAVRSLVNDLVR